MALVSGRYISLYRTPLGERSMSNNVTANPNDRDRLLSLFTRPKLLRYTIRAAASTTTGHTYVRVRSGVRPSVAEVEHALVLCQALRAWARFINGRSFVGIGDAWRWHELVLISSHPLAREEGLSVSYSLPQSSFSSFWR